MARAATTLAIVGATLLVTALLSTVLLTSAVVRIVALIASVAYLTLAGMLKPDYER
jgi:hypothetical protein